MTTRPFPRTPNLALRRARQSMRLSQAQFAEAVRAAGNAMGAPNHCTKRLVQKWETGEHATCRPDYLRVLQAVTGLSVRELGFQVLPDPSRVPTVGRSQAADGTDGDSSGDEGVVRTASDAFAMSGMTEYLPDGTPHESMDRLRRALEHPSMVDSLTAEFVELATARLFTLEHHSPARLLTPTVKRHLAMVTALLTAARLDKVRRRLTISAGHGTLLAGLLAFDRGDTASCTAFWDHAIAAAEATGDAGLLAATLTYQSYAAARRGDPASAWQLAHAASQYTPYDPRATAWATTRVAVYTAQLGERDEAETAINRALELAGTLPNPRPGDGTKPWLHCFDRAQLLSSAAHTAARLKDPRAAYRADEAVYALGTARVKTHAVILAEAAFAAATVGELELCLDWGSVAATLTSDMDVSIAADLLHEIVPLILPYSDTRAARELLPQLTRLHRTADLEDRAEQN